MKRFRNYLTVLVHAAAWGLLLLLNYYFVKDFIDHVNLWHQAANMAIYVSVFYGTYFLLMPLLYRKRTWFFALFSLLLIVSAFILKNYAHQSMQPMRFGFRPLPAEVLRKLDPSIDFKDGSLSMRERIQIREKVQWRFWGNPRMRGEMFSLLLVYVLGFSLRSVRKWKDDEQQKSELENAQMHTELAFLKQQINPHFLFNSLNSIYSLSISKSDQTTDSILKLSSILRYMLYRTEDSKVLLADEVEIIRDYIDLQKLRITDKVELKLTIEGDLKGYHLEPFILIPLIENAFKYGVDNANPSFIHICLKLTDDLLVADIKNKIALKQTENTSDSGIGLKNIKRRLELLYPSGYSLMSSRKNEVFLIHLELKLKK